MGKRGLLLVLAALTVASGCSLLAGVDFGGVHAKDESSSSGGGPDSGGLPDGELAEAAVVDGAVVEEGGTISHTDGGCAANQTTCNGACVSIDDPQFGCGSASCAPCSLAFTTVAKCTARKCAPGACAPGHGDCDSDPTTGCEADLSLSPNCGGCAVKCVAPTGLCSPSGCVGSCPPGTVSCSISSCIDVSTSVTHCGSCTNVCPTLANGDPTCVSGICGVACHAGFDHCDKSSNACQPLATFYRDVDGDGVGGATSTQACAAPAGYKATGGDCDDSNASVFPGQSTYFGVPYTNPALVASYDYDCDGNEVESVNTSGDHFVGACSVACDTAGYVTAIPLRSGTGVDSYCGSTRYRTCISTGIPLTPQASLPVIIGGCTSSYTVAGAVGCK